MVLSSRLEPKPKLMIPKRRTRFAFSEKTELYLIESRYCVFISTTMRPFFQTTIFHSNDHANLAIEVPFLYIEEPLK